MSESPMRRMMLLTIAILLLVPAALEARTWLVKQDGSGDCTMIQACIDSATAGDTVLVGSGIYYERIRIGKRASGVSLLSESGPEQTVIDGMANLSVVKIDSAGVGTALKGFTIRNGAYGMWPGAGAGICCSRSSVLIEGNVIRDNHCCCDGSTPGIFSQYGTSIIRRNLVIRNSHIAASGLTAVVMLFNDASTVEQNTIACNSITDDGGSPCGAAVSANSPTCILVGNIIAFNEGYGIRCVSGPPNPTLVCNDFWENTLGNYYGCGPGEGDISLDPQFCDPSEDNFFLSESSPCVNWPGCGQIGALGVACGPIGVKEENLTTWGRIKVLFR